MSTYRIYFMDHFSGHITRFEEFGAVSNEAAIAVAEGLGADAPLELWCGHNKVYRLDR